MCDIWLGFGSPSTLSNWSCDANNAPIQPVCSWAGSTCDRSNCGTVMNITVIGQTFSGTLSPSFGLLTNLIVISLKTNHIGGTIPTEFNQLTSLSYLYLSTNFLTGSIPDIFYNMRSLSQLYLDHNSLTRSVPPSIGSLSNLIVANFNRELFLRCLVL